MDEPTADPAILTAYLVCREARKQATGLLSGVGGDEIFAGYRKHVANAWAEEYRRVPGFARAAAERVLLRLPSLRGTRLKGFVRLAKKMARSAALSPEEAFIRNCTYLDARQKSGLYRSESQPIANDAAGQHLAAFKRVRHADFLNQMLYLDTKIFMTTLNLTYNDKMSMASSVEVRVPFLDRDLAEFVAWNVPPESKLKGKWRPVTKHIFREAMRSMLPDEVMRQPKAGFAAPVDYWLAHDLRPLVDDLLSEAQVRRRGLFRPEVVRAYIEEHRRGVEDWSMQIWQLLTLEMLDAVIFRRGLEIVRPESNRRISTNTVTTGTNNGMKQLLQDVRTGELEVAEVPAPQLLPGCVLVRVAASLVSAGTERAAAEFAGKSLLAKAKARPDLVRDVIAKMRRDGLASTLRTVRSRLDQPQSVGYSSAGVVVAVGDGVTDINEGDRVACAGAGFAVHAELACVPRLLLAKFPEDRRASAQLSCDISHEEAAFGTVGAICLHGIRTAEAALGDTVAVIGLGLLGQITVQLLKAAGCRVLGLDLLRQRADLAVGSGAEAVSTSARDFRDLCFQKTGGVGVDSVVVTAETPSSEPVNLAAELARDRAIVVAVGTVGMDLQRKLYYEKELDFRISRSYGPGRYDTAYEQKGRDYPIGHVRWTETRNLAAFLQFIADGKLNLQSLITHRFPIEQATRAYDLITGSSGENFLAALITYADAGRGIAPNLPGKIRVAAVVPASDSIGLGVLGAGSFAQNTLLPAFKAIRGVSLIGVCNATGPRSRSAAEKFGFSYCCNSERELLQDPTIDAVLIATRHNLHASQSLAALGAGKSVFCEKPLCLNEDDLAALVRAAWPRRPPQIRKSSAAWERLSSAGEKNKNVIIKKKHLAVSDGRFQSPVRAHGSTDEAVFVGESRGDGYSLPGECGLHSGRSLGERSRRGRRPHSRRGLSFCRLPLLSRGCVSD